MQSEDDLQKRYGSDWQLETLNRLLALDKPNSDADKLWEFIEHYTKIREGLRDQVGGLVMRGRELTRADEKTYTKVVHKLLALLDRLER